jgi:flagellar hook assembly protein FlgD
MEGKLVFSQHKDNFDIQTWDGSDNNENILQNGIYFIIIKAQTANDKKIYKGKVALLRYQ